MRITAIDLSPSCTSIGTPSAKLSTAPTDSQEAFARVGASALSKAAGKGLPRILVKHAVTEFTLEVA